MTDKEREWEDRMDNKIIISSVLNTIAMIFVIIAYLK